MTRYLLDTSVLVPLLLDYGEKLLNIASKTTIYTLDLTIYEAGNSLWKLVTYLNTIDLKDAENIMHVLKDLTKKEVVKTIRFNQLNPCKILELAANEKTTFYDASYIVASKITEATLVTEDKELREKAGKHVNTATYTQFKQKVKQKVKT